MSSTAALLSTKAHVIDAVNPANSGKANAMKAIPKTTGICATAYL
jgi:hypothetical protein